MSKSLCRRISQTPRRAVAITIGSPPFLPTPWLTKGEAFLGRARLRASLSKLKASHEPRHEATAVVDPTTPGRCPTRLGVEDPELTRLVGELAQDDRPRDAPRGGGPTFGKFLAEIRVRSFAPQAAGRGHSRIEQLKALESPTAEVPLPDGFGSTRLSRPL